MNNLAEGMDTGIGSSGGGYFAVFAVELVKNIFQILLDTRSVQLSLPAENVCSVVFNCQFVADFFI